MGGHLITFHKGNNHNLPERERIRSIYARLPQRCARALLPDVDQSASRFAPIRLTHPTTGLADWDNLPKRTKNTLGSLGFEVAMLHRASRVLLTRARNETLHEDVAKLARCLPQHVIGLDPSESLSLHVIVEGDEVKWAEASAAEKPTLSPVLLALFHLPGLRAFWRRELRRSHFERLRRVLPRAWFVTADPPIGAVVADLGITSWGQVSSSLRIRRVQVEGREIAVENYEPTSAALTLTYTRDRASAR